MTRILFVDDEPAILDALQNLLRKQRWQWDMVFALGGQAAMNALAEISFDVVISDMRMPGIDGAMLLAHVKEHYPQTARIVLSGHAERSAVHRALPVAHQFLSKPCDADSLKSAIERTCALHNLLSDDGIRRIVGQFDKLPSLPTSYRELLDAVCVPGANIAQVVGIIQRDPAMSIKVLQLVNSAYFGLPHRMTSIHQAVAYLGMEVLKGLALSAHVFVAMDPAQELATSSGGQQRRAFAVAQLSRGFVADSKRADEAFTSALVRDVGNLVIALGMPELHAQIESRGQHDHRRRHEIEKELLGVSHAEIGAYLLGVWGLPFAVVETVAFHHCPSEVKEGPREVLAAVHVADACVELYATEQSLEGIQGWLDLCFVKEAGVAGLLPGWIETAEHELRKTAEQGGRDVHPPLAG